MPYSSGRRVEPFESNLFELRSMRAWYNPDSSQYYIIASIERLLQLRLQKIYLTKGSTKQAAVLLPPLPKLTPPDKRCLGILNELTEKLRQYPGYLRLFLVPLCKNSHAANSQDLLFPTRDGRRIPFDDVGLDTIVQANPVVDPPSMDLKQYFPKRDFDRDPAKPIVTDTHTLKNYAICLESGWARCIVKKVEESLARNTFPQAVGNPSSDIGPIPKHGAAAIESGQAKKASVSTHETKLSRETRMYLVKHPRAKTKAVCVWWDERGHKGEPGWYPIESNETSLERIYEKYEDKRQLMYSYVTARRP